MRSIHRLYRHGLIATAFLLAAAWPVAALAQGHAHGGHAHEGGEGELLLIGEVSIGAGQLTLKSEAGEPSEVTVFGDAALFAAGRKGAFAGRVEIGFHTEGGDDDHDDGEEDDHKLATVEHDLRWEIGPRVHLVLSGNALADTLGSARGNVAVTNAPDGPLGNKEVHLGFEEVGLIGVEFPLGSVTLGLAVADRCLPQCGYGLDAMGDEAHPEVERRTIVPHLRGQVGELRYNVYGASSSGTFSSSQATGKGSAAGAGVFYDGHSWTVGLDVLGSKVECNSVAGAAPCTEDEKVSAWGVAFTVGGFGVHYVAHETTVGTEEEEETNIDVVYLFDVGGVVVGPEYRRVTHHAHAAGEEDRTDSLLLFGVSMEF